MWRGRILPELEEQLESARITGSVQLMPSIPPNDPSNPPDKKKKHKKPARTQTGGTPQEQNKGSDIPNPPNTQSPPNSNDGTSYQQGERLRSLEFEAPMAHAPRNDPTGKPLCWNFNANFGCPIRGQ